jgi:hypothetical protein
MHKPRNRQKNCPGGNEVQKLKKKPDNRARLFQLQRFR